MTGTIKKIIRPKGFGFITPDDGSEEDTVQFQTRKGEKGPVAFDLKIR